MSRAFNRLLHAAFYLAVLFIATMVLTMPITIEEKIVHTFAWVYLVLAYAYFFDENPPKFLRVEYLYGTAKNEYHKDYVDELVMLSQHSLSLMRKIQMNEDYRIVNKSISELEQRYRQLKKLSPPTDYHDSHLAILQDVEGFLKGLEQGNYHLIHGQTA